MTKPLKKTKGIAVFVMLTVVLVCFTTACTSPNVQEISTDPTPVADVQPAEDSQVPTDETLPEETPAIADEQPNISEEALQALQKYAINNEQTFEFLESEEYFGDKILYFFGDDITLYGLFESDLSLKSLGTKTYDVELPMQISEEEAKTIIINYAKTYWPDMEPVITEHEYYEYNESDGLYRSFNVDGVLMNPADQSKQPFHGTVNGKGELLFMGRTPNINIEQCIVEGTALTLEQAKERAYEHLNEYNPIISMNNLKTASEKLDNSYELYTLPIYIFEFEYRSDNPSTIDFDYDAYVAVNPSTGEHTGISVEPLMDNIDVLSMEEAEQIAKEYIVSNYDQELEDITTTFNQIFTCRNKLFYSFCFDYGEGDGCSITISAETGAIDGIGF